MHTVHVKVNQQSTQLFVGSMVMAAFVILIWGAMKPPEHAFDDAYITYRYADNFRNGLGLVYNPGEWVLGTTTPLFALLLGTLGFFFTDIELLGHWLGILGWIVAVWAAGMLFWQGKRPYTAVLALFFVALQPAMLNVVGMETPLVVALMLASAWAWLGKRSILAAFLLAALMVTRADGALWALIIGLEAWRRNGRLPWRVTVLTILLAVPWFLYAQWRYGSFLPNSIAAKAGQTTRMVVGGQTSFLRGFGEVWRWMPAIALLAFSLLVLAGLWVIVRDARKFWYLPVWITFYLAAYVALGVANFPWYYVPPMIMTVLIAAIGAGGLFGEGYAFVQTGQKRLLLAVASILALFVMTVWFGQIKIVQARVGYNETYRSIGQWLNQNTPENARTATIEIGVIGYLSQRPILDTMGLVSPEMTRRQVGWIETLAYAVSQEWIDTQTDERTAVTTVEPLNGGYKTSIWQPGDKLSLPVRLNVPDDLSPGAYRLGLFIYDPESGEGLPTTTTPAGGYPEVKLGWLRYGSPEDASSANLVSQPIQAAWQDGIWLEEIRVPAGTLAPGDVLPVGLQWYTVQTPLRDLTVFVHLI